MTSMVGLVSLVENVEEKREKKKEEEKNVEVGKCLQNERSRGNGLRALRLLKKWHKKGYMVDYNTKYT